MKKQNLSIIFLDNSVTSKNFACHFLHYDIFCLEEFEQHNLPQNPQIFVQNAKNNQPFNFVFCCDFVQQKSLKTIQNNINQNTIFLTNNIANYCLLKQQKLNCCYVDFNLENKEKLTLKSNQNIKDLPENISIKVNENLISENLSLYLINSSVGAVCLINNKTQKQAIFSYKLKTQILQLLKEQINLTNSVMLTVENAYNLNFYNLLSGKGFANITRQHTMLALALNKIKNLPTIQQVKNYVQQLLDINFNNFVQMPKTSKIMQEINIMLQNNIDN